MKNTLLPEKALFQYMRNTLVLVSLVVISLFAGCSSGPTTPGIGVGTQTTTIYGRVVDESGAPIAGVSLTGGTGTAVTDANGMFIIKNTTITQGRAVVIGKKAGYFDGAHAASPFSNGTTLIEFAMMSDAATASVPATTGGTVNIAAGGSIAFAAGSFTDATGAAYTGQVKVSARYLDPKNANFFDFFAGDDMAQTASGKTASLISCGVLRVELKDAAGNPLKLNATMPATLNFPKPIDTKAPTSMPLWYFDETIGMWKEEGSATLKNGMYSGTVAHFSEWNLDYHDSVTGSFSSASVSLRVVCNGVPISGVAVSIVGDDAPGKYFVHPGGRTGSDGTITFIRFPDNRPTLIDINSAKNNGLYYINNPISVNVTNGQTLNLGDVTLNSPCPASLQGTITDCNGAKTEGLVMVSDGKNYTYNYTKTGDFMMQAVSGSILTVNAIDANGNQATSVVVPPLASGAQSNIGNMKICGTGTANYLDITIPVSLGGTQQYGQSVALSPDGSRLALYSVSKIGIFDTKTGNLISSGSAAGVSYYLSSMQFSVDNTKLLISSSSDSSHSAVLYDVSGATVTNLITIASVTGAKLSDDGTQIIGVVTHAAPAPADLNIYKASDGSIVQTLHPTNISNAFGFDRTENAAVYPDGKTNGLAHVLSMTVNAELRNFPVVGNANGFISSEDGLTIASSSDYTNYSFYNTQTGALVGTIVVTAMNSTSKSNTFALTKNNAYQATQVDSANVIKVFNIANGASTLKLLSGTSYVASVAASRSEVNVAAVSNGKIRIWPLP